MNKIPTIEDYKKQKRYEFNFFLKHLESLGIPMPLNTLDRATPFSIWIRLKVSQIGLFYPSVGVCVVPDSYRMVTFDMVSNPANPMARICNHWYERLYYWNILPKWYEFKFSIKKRIKKI